MSQLSSRQFVIILIVTLAVFTLFHGLVWQLCTKHIFANEQAIGGLAKMSYKIDSLLPRFNEVTVDKQHIKFNEYAGQKLDAITIGDSFSNAGGGGENPYYQDVLTDISGLKVLNIPQFSGTKGYIETVAMLANSGFLQDKGVHHVIVESVQREVIPRFNRNLDLSISREVNLDNNYQIKSKAKYCRSVAPPQFVNNRNYNAVKYNLLYHFDDHAYSSQCYRLTLSQNLFSSRNKRQLLGFYHDLTRLELESLEAIQQVNANLNQLAQLLAKQGIKLYFMPAVDKYTLYYDYIIDNPYPQSQLFEWFRQLDKQYIFIDTKQILQSELDKGVTDIYYPDDTHWSSYARGKVVESMVKNEFN